jgi:RNA polymerase sigma factor (TIGR02999 family)
MARHHLRNERPEHTLQPTALVNEVYVRLVDYKNVRLEHRAQFFKVASKVMRHVLVDHARTGKRDKRGGDRKKVSPEDVTVLWQDGLTGFQNRLEDLLALDEAMTKLKGLYPRKAEVVEMRVFGGMNNQEIAAALEIHPNVVIRDWKFARAWLHRELSV